MFPIWGLLFFGFCRIVCRIPKNQERCPLAGGDSLPVLFGASQVQAEEEGQQGEEAFAQHHGDGAGIESVQSVQDEGSSAKAITVSSSEQDPQTLTSHFGQAYFQRLDRSED